MQHVRHHGRDIAYRVSDRSDGGPPILCIHGSGGNAGIWKSQSRLADHVPVVSLDLSGHGDSEDVNADPGIETLEAYAMDVEAVATETDAEVLVGNSLGGAIAMWIALEHEFTPSGLVLAGTGAKLAVLDDLLAWLSGDFDRALEFLHKSNRLFHDPDDRLVSVSKAAMVDTGRAVTERDFLTAHTFDIRDRLTEIDVPSLAIVGEHDQLTPPWYHEFLAEHIPDCGLAHVEDAAHLTMLEQPAAFNAAIGEFLDRL